MNKKERGITLIALSVTIIVLIILAGISVSVLNGENGLIKKAIGGKEAKEISEEKEIIDVSVAQAIDEDVIGNLEKNILQNKLDGNVGEDKTEVIDNFETKVIIFKEKDRYYEVMKDGSIEGPKEIIKDEYAGDLTKNNTCEGTEEKTFEINCIEDLVAFSMMVNGGNETLGLEADNFLNKKVVLMRTLDFQSIFSYNDYTTTIYGDLNTDGTVEDIRTELTKKEEGCIGFTPIGNGQGGSLFFKGIFDGENNRICNLYESGNTYLGLFGTIGGGNKEQPVEIKNLTITGNIKNATWHSGGLMGGAYHDVYLKLDNIKNYINITSISASIGGLIGDQSGGDNIIKINNCYNYGKILNATSTGIGDCSAGGLIGYSRGGNFNITNCANYAKIDAKDDHPYDGAGGIIGGGWNPIIEICNTCNYGEIRGNLRAGGIIGSQPQDAEVMAKLVNVFNAGKITVSKGWTPGGLVAYTYSKNVFPSAIINSYYDDNCAKGVGNWNVEAGTRYTKEQLQSAEFVQTLNDYISSNTDGIDTTGWCKWKYNENGYPTME